MASNGLGAALTYGSPNVSVRVISATSSREFGPMASAVFRRILTQSSSFQSCLLGVSRKIQPIGFSGGHTTTYKTCRIQYTSTPFTGFGLKKSCVTNCIRPDSRASGNSLCHIEIPCSVITAWSCTTKRSSGYNRASWRSKLPGYALLAPPEFRDKQEALVFNKNLTDTAPNIDDQSAT